MTPKELLNGLFGSHGDGAQDEFDNAVWWESSDVANELDEREEEWEADIQRGESA